MSRVANFVEIIKIVTMFIKTNFKDSNKVRKNQKLCIKMQSTSAFLEIVKIADFW